MEIITRQYYSSPWPVLGHSLTLIIAAVGLIRAICPFLHGDLHLYIGPYCTPSHHGVYCAVHKPLLYAVTSPKCWHDNILSRDIM